MSPNAHLKPNHVWRAKINTCPRVEIPSKATYSKILKSNSNTVVITNSALGASPQDWYLNEIRNILSKPLSPSMRIYVASLERDCRLQQLRNDFNSLRCDKVIIEQPRRK